MPLEISEALFGLAGLAVGAGAGYFGTRLTARTTLQVAREKLEAENRLANAASAAIKALLQEPGWELRSFDAIKNHVRGFADDELRKLLVSCDAVAFKERGSDREIWGLRERNADELRPREGERLEAQKPDAAPGDPG